MLVEAGAQLENESRLIPDLTHYLSYLNLLLRYSSYAVATLDSSHEGSHALEHDLSLQAEEHPIQSQNFDFHQLLEAQRYGQPIPDCFPRSYQDYSTDVETFNGVNSTQSYIGLSDPAFEIDSQDLIIGYAPHQTISSLYDSNLSSVSYPSTAPGSRKRSRNDEIAFDYTSRQTQPPVEEQTSLEIPIDMLSTQYGRSRSPSYSIQAYQAPTQRRSSHQTMQSLHSYQTPSHTEKASDQALQHHHHRLPNQPPPTKRVHHTESSPESEGDRPPNMVGRQGMPVPAPRPKGPKLKFSRDDDALLIDLKENKDLTWKQIADFFPGRSSGTLQVRYCTKLKAKTVDWSDDMVSLGMTLLASLLSLFDLF